jgi:hypothetical protein
VFGEEPVPRKIADTGRVALALRAGRGVIGDWTFRLAHQMDKGMGMCWWMVKAG